MELPIEGGRAEAAVPGIDTPRAGLLAGAVFSAELGAVPDYRCALLSIPPAPGDISEVHCLLIVISEVNSQFLVAVPSAAWHRQTIRRALPPQSLIKPFHFAVAARGLHDIEPLENVFTKVWVGYLNPQFERCVKFAGIEDLGEVLEFLAEDSGDPVLPSAEGLIQLADEKFSFLTALSGNGEGPAMDADSRLQQLENNMEIIQKNLQTILDGMPLSTAAAASGPSGAPRNLGTGASVRPKTQPAIPPGASGEHLSYPGIDPSVVQAAMQAGVREEELVTMSRIVGRKATKLGDFPQRGLVVPDVLGDSDGEAEARQAAVLTAPPGLEAPVPSDPVSAALVQLTNIVSNLADKRKKPKNLGEVLEEAGGAEIASSSSGGIGTQRRQAAVFRALKKSLLESPKEIYQVIEKLMIEDFGSREIMPGEPPRSSSFRGWLEHRSRIPNLAPTVRIAWSIGRALDALKVGRVEECQARLALRPWPMVDSIRIQPRTDASLQFIQPSHTSRFSRMSSQSNLGWEMGGCCHVSGEGVGRLCRKESQVRKRPQRRWWISGKSRGGEGKEERTERLQAGGSLGENSSVHAATTTGPRRVPGAVAKTVDIQSTWDKIFRILLSMHGNLKSFFRSMFRKPATSDSEGGTATLWPIPLPYPGVFGKASDVDRSRRSFQRGVCVAVLVLDWLHLRRPAVAPLSIVNGRPLTRLQWKIVRQMEEAMVAWKSASKVTAADMGRTAGKIEDIESAIDKLASFELAAFASLDPTLSDKHFC